eukprot:2760656-Rhodomonas_salina.2
MNHAHHNIVIRATSRITCLKLIPSAGGYPSDGGRTPPLLPRRNPGCFGLPLCSGGCAAGAVLSEAS